MGTEIGMRDREGETERRRGKETERGSEGRRERSCVARRRAEEKEK